MVTTNMAGFTPEPRKGDGKGYSVNSQIYCILFNLQIPADITMAGQNNDQKIAV